MKHDARGIGMGMLMVLTMTTSHADEWSDAAAAISRLQPTAFNEVPRTVVDRLMKEGCLVPQASAFVQGRHNVIAGRFAAPGQIDHAALCSKDGRSHIEIVWGGPVHCASRIEESRDEDSLQTYGPGRIVYSRAVFPATQKTIGYYRKAIGGPPAPDRHHAGIEDHFLEKGSIIHYCSRGAWHTLQGMD